MFGLKDFLTAMVLAFLCLLIKITPACAAQVEIFIPTEDYSVEIVTVDSEKNDTIHSPPPEDYEENIVTPDKMRISLTVEENTTVETFYPLEEADYGQYVVESTSAGEDVLVMIPLITQDTMIDGINSQEVTMALALSATDFPSDNGNKSMAQLGLMWFF